MSDDDEEEMLELIEMDDISFLKKNRDALTQSIAERVCEVLAREVENEPMKRPKPEDAIMENPLKLQLFIGGFHAGVREVLDIITRPRDWAKELEDKK